MAVKQDTRTIAQYSIERRIAVGGMAEVFLARRTGPHSFSKRVALKCILPQFAQDPEFLALFVNEARLASQLEHPNIVQVFDFGVADGEPFLAMEFVAGTSVSALLQSAAARQLPVPLDVALHIACEGAMALNSAHQAADEQGRALNIVHRDVSPGNLLLTRSGHVKLSDFGIARAANLEVNTGAGRRRGKVGYMSPEHVRGEHLDGRSDVFTLCVVLAELLILEPLFGRGDDLDVLMKIREGDLSVLEKSPCMIPNDVRRLLNLGLRIVPEKRPDASAFSAMIKEVLHRRYAYKGYGPERVAQFLLELDLTTELTGTGEFPIIGPGPSLKPAVTKMVDSFDVETDRVNSSAQQEPAIYRLERPGHAVSGPFSYRRIFELILAGAVDPSSLVSKEGARFVPLAACEEFRRVAKSPAYRWNGVDATAATYRGSLQRGSLVPLVHRLTRRRETGALHLVGGPRQKKIYFLNGRPDFVSSTDRSELLGEFLVQQGVCLRMEVDIALAVMPQYGGRLGDALTGLGILRPVELYRVFHAQTRSRLLEAFRWRQGDWYYVRGAHSGEETVPMPDDPCELIRDAIKEVHGTEIEAALSPHSSRLLAPAPARASLLESYCLPSPWEAVLSRIDEPTTIAAVLADESRRHDADSVYRALYLGIACELLTLAGASRLSPL